MSFSNRLWHAIAWRLRERYDCIPCMMVWAKISYRAKGKRHALIAIEVSDEERGVIADLFAHCQDDYWQKVVRHEMENVRGRTSHG